jgi:Domain of unknown function (DUF927)
MDITFDNAALRKDDGEPVPRLRIIGTVYHIERRESYYRVAFRDLDGKRRVLDIGREQFQRPSTIVSLLLKRHADLPEDKSKAEGLVRRAVKERGDRNIRMTSRSGWRGSSFVYPTRTFGPLAHRLVHEGVGGIDPALGLSRGTLRAWREGLRKPCEYSDFLIFALSVPAAGPLLAPIEQHEGAIFHLHGTEPEGIERGEYKTKSTSGKTTALCAAASTMGRCRKNDLVSFAMTERGAEELFAGHNHLMLCIDEEGRAVSAGGRRIDPKVLPYIVTSGRGIRRSQKAAEHLDLPDWTWCLLALSSGENPLDSPGGTVRTEGAQVRQPSIPVPPGRKGGIFNRVKKGPSAAMATVCRGLARQIETTINQNYGVLMPAYLSRLVLERRRIARGAQKIVERFVKQVGADIDPWETRFATAFGIVLAGALALVHFGLAPWTRARAWTAITEVYRRARSASVSIKDSADTLVRKLGGLLAEKKRLALIEKGASAPPEKAGQLWGVIRTTRKHGRVLAVDLDHLRSLVTVPAILGTVLRTLVREGIVLPGRKGIPTRQVMITGLTGKVRPRYVLFVERALVERAGIAAAAPEKR